MNNSEYQLTGHVIRPPAEADSVILQLMEGCPHNRCSFCATYRDTNFRVKTETEFEQHVKSALGAYDKNSTRIFICDGDVISLGTTRILESISIVKKYFIKASRFGIYARAGGVLQKSPDELKKLRSEGLKIFYVGLESGSDRVLKNINKGVTSAEIVDAVVKAEQCGIKCSVMALVGLGGKEFSTEHAAKTAEAFRKMNPRFINLLTVMPIKGTELYNEIKEGKFTPLNDIEALEEIKDILSGISGVKSIFRANHASNPLALSGTLPRDKNVLLEEIKSAISGEIPVRMSFLRGL